MLLALWMAIYSAEAKNDGWMYLFGFFAIGGLPEFAFRAFTKPTLTIEQEIAKLREEIANDSGSTMMTSIMGFIFHCIFSIIVTPFFTLCAIFELVKYQLEKRKLKILIENFPR